MLFPACRSWATRSSWAEPKALVACAPSPKSTRSRTGARSRDGRVEGTYLHGLFTSDPFRDAWLRGLGARPSTFSYVAEIDTVLDELALHIEAHLDVEALLRLTQV